MGNPASVLDCKTFFARLYPLVNNPPLNLFPEFEGSRSRSEGIHHLRPIAILAEMGMSIEHEHILDTSAGFGFYFDLEHILGLTCFRFVIRRGAINPLSKGD